MYLSLGHRFTILKLPYVCTQIEQIGKYVLGNKNWISHKERKEKAKMNSGGLVLESEISVYLSGYFAYVS